MSDDGKQVQVVGKGADDTAVYVGLDREITVDTDNRDLIIHDGETPGGVRVMSLPNADQRYQSATAEVTGIGPFETDAAGLLVRRGYQDYVLRSVTASSEFTVTNPNGQNGDIYLALSGAIGIPITFGNGIRADVIGNFQGNGAFGAFTGAFAGPLVGGVTGNVTGNLIGNSNGTHTGPVIGAVTGNVTGDLTGNSTGTHTGPVMGNVTGNVSGNAGGTAASLANVRNVAMTGDVAWNVNFNGAGDVSSVGTIQANAVTNVKLAQMASKTVKGNTTGGLANAADLTQAQLTALINAVVGDSGAGGTLGAVPAPGVGSAAAGLLLTAAGGFAQAKLDLQTLSAFVPSGGGVEFQLGPVQIKIAKVVGSLGESSTIFAFAHDFTTACLVVLPILMHDHTYGGTDNDYFAKIIDNSITAHEFGLRVEAAAGASGNVPGFWYIAVGY